MIYILRRHPYSKTISTLTWTEYEIGPTDQLVANSKIKD